jgi:2-keto-4-pentenoate hydratase/2-oxohepta-3-ene-1,7-dioic acid hydratase in catechol pathway
VPCSPTKIVCVGRNYAGHAKELGNEVPAEPLLFFKPPSSLLADGGAILVPSQSKRVEHEGELAIVLGARGRRMTPLEAEAAVFGVTVANDVTARDLQRSDGQWTRAKGFDTFCPVGPWIETGLDTKALRVMCRVNGQTRQDGRTTQMIFDVPTIVAYVSSVMTLERGDVILTGTPEGVGPLAPGDVCEVELQEAESGRSVCLLRSQVRAE